MRCTEADSQLTFSLYSTASGEIGEMCFGIPAQTRDRKVFSVSAQDVICCQSNHPSWIINNYGNSTNFWDYSISFNYSTFFLYLYLKRHARILLQLTAVEGKFCWPKWWMKYIILTESSSCQESIVNLTGAGSITHEMMRQTLKGILDSYWQLSKS